MVSSDIAPIERQERIHAMDALRGFALLGVATINMFTFLGPMERILEPWKAFRGLQFLVLALVQGKFYCLFSLLFGMGFAVQLARMEASGRNGPRFYRRRLIILLLIGLAHGLLVWMGDILLPYALLGFALLAFRRRKDRTLLRWALALLVFNIALALFEAAHGGRHGRIAEGQIEAVRAYAQGPYSALFQVRLRQMLQNYARSLIGVGPQILSMFLCGAWAGRKGLLREPEAHRPLLIRIAAWGLGLGLPCNVLYAWMMLQGGASGPGHALFPMAYAFFLPTGPLLTFGMAAAFVLLFPGFNALQKLAPAGRMALTNYLCHSLVFTSVFSFWGTGSYGRVPPWVAPPLALATWLAQIPLSAWWLRRFRMGPFEWGWRSLTYGAAQVFRCQEA